MSDVPAVDDFDRTCKEHDAQYAINGDLLHADLSFAKQNFGKSFKRTAAAVAVGGQAGLRALDKFIPKIYQTKETMSFRGSKIQVHNTPAGKAHNQQEKINNMNSFKGRAVSVPAVMGTVLRGNAAQTTKRGKDSISMDVQVCIGRPAAALQSGVPELIAVQYLAPVCLGNDEVQNMTRVYQHYRITEATMHFRSFQATSSGGEVIVIGDSDPNYRPINTAVGSSFYQRALATKHSLLTPIWMSETVELPVDSGWKVCDNANSTTLEEFQSGVAYIYADGSVNTPGFFLLRVKIEFEGLRFNSRLLISGSYLGMGAKISLAAVAPLLGANVSLTGTGFTAGDVYSVQLSTTGATFGAGTASNLFTLATSAASSTSFTVTGSTLLYARTLTSTTIEVFTTYDAAVGSDTADRLLFGVTSGGTTTMPSCIITQLRNSAQPTL